MLLAAVLPLALGPAAGAASSNTLSVTAGEYAYALKGAPKSGWNQIGFTNAGSEMHMMAVFQLKPGVTAAQLKAAATSQDPQTAFEQISAPNADPNGVSGVPDTLGPQQGTVTLAKLTPGHYGIACFVPAPDGLPHVAHGMVKVFDVGRGRSGVVPPRDGVTKVTLTDSSIDFPATTVGRTLVAKVTNTGTAPHSFTLVKINPGSTIDEVRAYFTALFNSPTPPTGTPPGALVGGIASVNPGSVAYVEQTLKPGHYAYVSTQGNAPDDDYAHGLHGEFDVK